MARGARRAHPQASVHILPIADGGDGTFEVLCSAFDARRFKTVVLDPLRRRVNAVWALTRDGMAIIEMAGASGLRLLKPGERDPLRAGSFGTGQLVREALARGARRVILGVGGSATVDGGTGALSALGFRFIDKMGRALPPGGGSLVSLHRIDDSCALPFLREACPHLSVSRVEFTIACDVDNLMAGPFGAARVFGPQKGADPREVERLEAGLARLSRAIRRFSGRSVLTMVRAGAAGGFAGGFWGLGLARLESGFDVVSRAVGLDPWVRWADLILTGEGSLDSQSFSGKAVGRLVQRAVRFKTPVIALAPHVSLPAGLIRRFPGFQAVRISQGRRRVSLGQLEGCVKIIVKSFLNLCSNS
jgi:glycerate kinase